MTEKPAQRRPRERTLFLIAAAVFAAAVVWLVIALISGATPVNLRGRAGAAMMGVVACAVAVLAVWRSQLGRLRAEREESERLAEELRKRDAVARQELQEARQDAQRRLQGAPPRGGP